MEVAPSRTISSRRNLRSKFSGFQQRIDPSQSRKPCKITVRSVQHAAVFNRKSRQFCISGKGTANLTLQQHLPEQTPMTLSWNQQSNLRQVHPLIDHTYRFLGGVAVAWQP